MARIRKDELWELLLQSEALAAIDSPVPIQPVLMGLAQVESRFKLDALGDGGKSVGLWQIHSAFHAWPEGGPEAGPVEQIEAVIPVMQGWTKWVNSALKEISGEAIREAAPMPPASTIAVWYSILHQYGPRDFLEWIRSAEDFSSNNYAAYHRNVVGERVMSDFNARQAKYLNVYRQWERQLPPESLAGKIVEKGKSIFGSVYEGTKKGVVGYALGQAITMGVVAWVALRYFFRD